MRILKLNDPLLVRALLRQGRRIEAANLAEHCVRAAEKDVRLAIRALADEVRLLGDRQQKPGRPIRRLATKQTLAINQALYAYRAAISCRNLVDGRELSPHQLALLAIQLGEFPIDTSHVDSYQEKIEAIGKHFAPDISSARKSLLSPAKKWLQRLKLSDKSVHRRNFKAVTKRRISEIYGVSVNVIQRKLSR